MAIPSTKMKGNKDVKTSEGWLRQKVRKAGAQTGPREGCEKPGGCCCIDRPGEVRKQKDGGDGC